MYDVIPVVTERAVDCGPVCLKMLLAYYDTEVDLETLITECNTRIVGCTGKDIIRVGRLHGLDMKAFQMDAEELVNQDRPAIVWWMFKHFVVFCGKDENGQVVLCDPARGRYRMSAGLFKQYYSKVSFWNGEPEPLPVEEIATAEDYEHALTELGVEV